MNCKNVIQTVSVALLAGVFSFAVGRLSGSPAPAQRGNVARWLSLTTQQQQAIRQADPTYEDDIAALKARLGIQRKAMADLLMDSAAREAEIQSRGDEIAKIEEAMKHRVMRHLLEMRSCLSPDQVRRLMSLAADEVLQADRLSAIPACCATGTCKCSAKTAARAVAPGNQ